VVDGEGVTRGPLLTALRIAPAPMRLSGGRFARLLPEGPFWFRNALADPEVRFRHGRTIPILQLLPTCAP
jgi:hypothetical protein